ncbi:amidohydrolase family protein [uncultured Arthrobacter sp.]|uniref:amidohydrolase family protein n=1 Tax=uncultured Arthrobacter sp. TaxID=114050 RepID=UPI002636F22B|nr:amidohydrolase family protein [uncultured Arthrobacter sp.]
MNIGFRFKKALTGPALEVVEDVWITVDDEGRICSINEGGAPAGTPYHPAEIAVPGLVDCHVHLALSGGADVEREARESTAAGLEEVLLANATKHLESGVTTVRDLGSPNDIVLTNLRKGRLHPPSTPRIVGGGAVSSPAGHGNFLSRWATTLPEYEQIIGEVEAAGADFLKLFATGGVVTAGTVPGATQMDGLLLSQVTDLAHRFGLRVAAHAHGEEGIRNAIRAGVDSIEHFSYLTDEDAGLLPNSPTTLVSTLVATERFVQSEDRQRATPETLAKILAHAPHEREALARAVGAGLPIAVGTDAGTTFNPHGWGMQEQAELLAETGMKAREILLSMTVRGALLLGLPSGSLSVGNCADILCLDADPTLDVRALWAINEVILGGISVRK